MKKLTAEVPIGLGSLLGVVGTAAAVVTCVVQSLNENQALLTGQNKTAGLVAFGVSILTALGRMYQAKK